MKRFNSFQGLRAIAFLLVFFSHCTGFLPIRSGGHGAIGVEIFFVLSGFLMEVHARESDENLLRQCLSSARKKLGKFYWLHIATLVLATGRVVAQWVLQRPDVQTVIDLCWKVAANVLLIQSWIPDSNYYFSLNAVAWYLSTSMLMYLLFPLFHRWIQGCRNNGIKYAVVLLIYIVQFILARSMQSSVYLHAVLYVHPMTRCLDFVAGMLLGSAYLCRTGTVKNHGLWIWLEAAALALLVMVILLFNHVPEAYRYVVLSAPVAWILISVFAYDSGRISSFLSGKLLTFIGNLSFELFMIHLLAIRYVGYILRTVQKILNYELPEVIIMAEVFAISLLASYALHGIGNRIHSHTKRTFK